MNTSIDLELATKSFRKPTFAVLVDMDGDGVYEVDITDDVDSIDYVDLTLEQRSARLGLGKPWMDTASITLWNNQGLYSPDKTPNIEDKYPGKFQRNTGIKIQLGFLDAAGNKCVRDRFVGVMVSFNNKVSLTDKKITITCHDLFKFAKKKKNPNNNTIGNVTYKAALFDVTISEAVNYLIDYCYGTSWPRQITTLTEKFPIIEFNIDDNVFPTIQQLAEACDARVFFDGSIFKFLSPLSSEYVTQNSDQFAFTTNHIFDLTGTTDENNIINKWRIVSNPKTMQPRQILVGTPSTNIISAIDTYKYNDGKNAVRDDRVISLKFWENNTWVISTNLPLVDTITYSDLVNPAPEDIQSMNQNSPIKVWNKNSNVQLTIFDIDCNLGEITMCEDLPPDYNLEIVYQYYNDRLVFGRHRWYIYDLEKVATNIELPIINVHDGYELVSYSTSDSVNKLYLSDWTIIDGNKRIKFKLTNNVPIRTVSGETLNKVYITKFEVYGNPLECVSPMTVEAIDGTTIGEFENVNEINNDYFVDPDFTKQACDYYLYQTQNPCTLIEANCIGIPQLDLLDRVKVTESTTGVDYDFVVTGIRESFGKDRFKALIKLEPLQSVWIYTPSRVTAKTFQPVITAQLALPAIEIKSNGVIANNFSNGVITHSTVLTFNSPAKYNISNFLEAKVIYQEATPIGWGREVVCSSFTELYTTSYTVTGLRSDTQYRFFIIAVTKNNNKTPYNNGYSIITPTTGELQTVYPAFIAPTNVKASRSIDRKATISCDLTTQPHYKSIEFQFVKESLGWNDASVESKIINVNFAIFTMTDAVNYLARVRYIDIWDRVGAWSSDVVVDGSLLDESNLDTQMFLIEVTSENNPGSGALTDLYDGDLNTSCTINGGWIQFKYVGQQFFSSLRLTVDGTVEFYAEYYNEETSQWVACAGTSGAHLVTTEVKNIYNFTNIVVARKLRINLTGSATIKEMHFGTKGEIDDLRAEKITVDELDLVDSNGNTIIDANGVYGNTVQGLSWANLSSLVRLFLAQNEKPFIIQEADGSYGFQFTPNKAYKLYADADTYVDYAHTGTNYNGEDLKVGAYTNPNTFADYYWRTYIKFPIDQVPSNENVVSVIMGLYGVSSSCNIEIRRVTSAWNEASMNWNNQPTNNTTLLASGMMYGNNSYKTWSGQNFIDFANNILDGVNSNYGFYIKSTSNTDNPYPLIIRCREYADVSQRPYFYVETVASAGLHTTVTNGSAYINNTIIPSGTLTFTNLTASAINYLYVIVNEDNTALIPYSTTTFADIPTDSTALIIGTATTDGTHVIGTSRDRNTGRKEGPIGCGNDVVKLGYDQPFTIDITNNKTKTFNHNLGTTQYRVLCEVQDPADTTTWFNYENAISYESGTWRKRGISIIKSANSITFQSGAENVGWYFDSLGGRVGFTSLICRARLEVYS